MKVRIAGIALSLLAMASVGESQTAVRANVPFTFHACETSFAAGAYELSRPSTVREAWTIRSTSGEAKPCIVMARNGVAGDTETVAKLVFHRYGDTYFLSQVWAVGESTGYELPPSKLEREFAGAASAPKVASVEVFRR